MTVFNNCLVKFTGWLLSLYTLSPATTELVPESSFRACTPGQTASRLVQGLAPGQALRTGSVHFFRTSAPACGKCVPSPRTQPRK